MAVIERTGGDEDSDPDDDRTRTGARRHMTTVLLEERAEGEWLATQGGIPVEGRGETAAEAAADYCRKIDAGVHEDRGECDE